MLGVYCDPYTYRIDNCSLREGSRVEVFFLGAIVYLFSFSFGLTIHKKCRKIKSQVLHHMIKSHEECGKIVHRPCSSCISSVQEINKDSIEFFLLTQTWSGFKSSWLKSYNPHHHHHCHPTTTCPNNNYYYYSNKRNPPQHLSLTNHYPLERNNFSLWLPLCSNKSTVCSSSNRGAE